jgi:hypothetical protein
LSNQRQIVFFGFMFVCSLCSIRANAAVFASVRISDPPVHLLICYGRCLKLVAARPALLNHIAVWQGLTARSEAMTGQFPNDPDSDYSQG